MTTNVKSVTQHFMFWLLIAFIAGFAFSEILVRMGVNPLRSSAFMPGDDTIFCGPGGNAEEMGYVCGNPYQQRAWQQNGTPDTETGPYGGGIPVLRDKNGVPINNSQGSNDDGNNNPYTPNP